MLPVYRGDLIVHVPDFYSGPFVEETRVAMLPAADLYHPGRDAGDVAYDEALSPQDVVVPLSYPHPDSFGYYYYGLPGMGRAIFWQFAYRDDNFDEKLDFFGFDSLLGVPSDYGPNPTYLRAESFESWALARDQGGTGWVAMALPDVFYSWADGVTLRQD